MNRKISIGMAVTIVILAMTVTFSITMLVAMRLFGAGGRYERLRLFGVADDGVAFDTLRENRAKIGRASCRERV